MILTNGVIWTGDPARPWAQAMRLGEGRVAAVGAEAAVRAGAPAGLPELDLAGAFVCPGLVDAHGHVLGFGLGLTRVDLVGTASLEEALERVAAEAVRPPAGGGEGWILGRGWDQNDWPGAAFPTAGDLDRVCAGRPASLSRVDGHARWVNTAALERAGITAATPDPPGGRILRDASGTPTGILLDKAMDLVGAHVPSPTRGEKEAAVRRAGEALVRAGLTAVHDMGMSPEEAEIYRELAAAGELPLRIYGALEAGPSLWEGPEGRGVGVAEAVAAGPDREWRGGRFKLAMVKFYVDGALGSRGAALLAPYSDDPGNAGLVLTAPADLEAGMIRCLRAGFQCAVHAIGDRANRIVLDAWQAIREGDPEAARPRPAPGAPLSLLGAVPPVVPPVRLEHAQIIHPRDLSRVAGLGVVASMQPTHCTSDMPWAPERLGPDRMSGAYAWRSLADRGTVLALGSDFPVESHDPLRGLYAATARRGRDGNPPAGWTVEERLGREEALAACTAAPAYASGDLDRLGTLTPGKQADFTVFDRNLVTCDPERLLDARVLLTVVGGTPAWADPESAPGRWKGTGR